MVLRTAPAGDLSRHQEERVGRAISRITGRNGGPRAAQNRSRSTILWIQEMGKATPYGIYDLGLNGGWVSVGIDHDTAEFAVETIRRWWRSMGQTSLSSGDSLADHRRRRREQRFPATALESRTAKTSRRNRPAHHGLSLPARHQQVEQDRASPFLLHQPKLARKAAAKF